MLLNTQEPKAYLFSNALLLNTKHRLMNFFTNFITMCISTVQNFDNQTAVSMSSPCTVIFPVQLYRRELLCQLRKALCPRSCKQPTEFSHFLMCNRKKTPTGISLYLYTYMCAHTHIHSHRQTKSSSKATCINKLSIPQEKECLARIQERETLLSLTSKLKDTTCSQSSIQASSRE